MLEKLLNLFRRLRKPKKKVTTATIQVEGDTVERCPHVASGESKAVASVVLSPTRVRDLCSECYKTYKHPENSLLSKGITHLQVTVSHKKYPRLDLRTIRKKKHPEPKSKFFKPRTAYQKRLWKKDAKPEDEENN